MRKNVSFAKCNLGLVPATLLCLLLLVPHLRAGDLCLPLPGRNTSTPVQNLNRAGVRQLQKGNQQKAAELFYRAYLLDPNDPFTLNNLGYLAELQGNAERALQFYQLAGTNKTNAVIDVSTHEELKGRPVAEATAQAENSHQRINRANEQAMALLSVGRAREAKSLLSIALQSDRRDPFVLNNLGFVMETEGDLESALQFYSAAAALHSDARVVVTSRPAERGRPISEVAGRHASEINELLARGENRKAAVARLNLRGVAALNSNHPDDATRLFLEAYRQDPQNAFTLNNLGYVSELKGDRETAQMYYDAAREGTDANLRVTYATRTEAEGRKLERLAEGNVQDVGEKLREIQQEKRRADSPIRLKTREPQSSTDTQPHEAPPLGMKPPPLPPLPLPGSSAPIPYSEPSRLPSAQDSQPTTQPD